MTTLELHYYAAQAGIATYKPGNAGVQDALMYQVELGEGETSESRASEAATWICANLEALGFGEWVPAVENPPLPPGPPTSEEVLRKYVERAAAAPLVMARWASYNEGRLLAYSPPEDPEDYDPDLHGWSPEAFANFMGKVAPVVVLLNSLAFGATAQAVQAFDDPLATAAAKQAYLDAMAAEGALPQ